MIVALLACIDAAVVALAWMLAFVLAFDIATDPRAVVYAPLLWMSLPVLLGVRLAALWLAGIHRVRPRDASLDEAWRLARAVALGSLLFLPFAAAPSYLPASDVWPSRWPRDPAGAPYRVPWRLVALEAVLSLSGLGGWRLATRLVWRRWQAMEGEPIIVVGDGPAAASLVHRWQNHPEERLAPMAVIALGSVAARLHGVPVVSRRDDVAPALDRLKPRHAFIALERPDPGLLRDLAALAGPRGLRLHKLSARPFALPAAPAGSIPLEIEDLLGRPPAPLASRADWEYLRGAKVLVTGAGGSIGRELCRVVAEHAPAELIALGRGEFSLYELQQELKEHGLADRLTLVLADLRDPVAVRRALADAHPAILLHAAAHKHVPMLERHPREALRNNTLATRDLARAAQDAGVERLVVVSTDKAVRPAGWMGASKRLAEQALAVDHARGLTPPFLAMVRFGNVLGSRGSVVPLFRRQIARGGPITLSHPDATRYFMTVGEAARLVVQAGGLVAASDKTSAPAIALYLLDMGQPLRIGDLAMQMIALAGLSATDIAVEQTGLQPGEKLHEELLIDPTQSQPTAHPAIFSAPVDVPDAATFDEQLNALIAELDQSPVGAAGLVKRMIPDALL